VDLQIFCLLWLASQSETITVASSHLTEMISFLFLARNQNLLTTHYVPNPEVAAEGTK
jgi:hypothetical protein